MVDLNEQTILITKEVPASRCFGDLESGVRPFAPYIPEDQEGYKKQEIQLSPIVKKALELGLHVYITESDSYMFYAPDNIDTQAQAVLDFLSKH